MFILGGNSSAYYNGTLTAAPATPIWQSVLGLWAVTMEYIYVDGQLTDSCESGVWF